MSNQTILYQVVESKIALSKGSQTKHRNPEAFLWQSTVTPMGCQNKLLTC